MMTLPTFSGFPRLNGLTSGNTSIGYAARWLGRWGVVALFWCLSFQAVCQQFHYSLINNGLLYYSELVATAKESDVLYTFDVENQSRSKVEHVANLIDSYLPYCWGKSSQKSLMYASGFGQGSGESKIRFKKVPLNEDGFGKLLFEGYDSLARAHGEKRALMIYLDHEEKASNTRMFVPLNNWLMYNHLLSRQRRVEDIYSYLSYDWLPLGDEKYLIYLRNKKELTVWMYQYPEPGERSLPSDWEEMNTFSADTLPFLPAGITEIPLLPSGKHHRYQSIPDSAFFQGHFKAIRQGGETFIFNTTTGYLYHLGPEDIARVGQVSLKNYPRWLFGKPLFIEDRDAGELVFFAEAERAEGARAFPKVALAKNRLALNERYPGLAGK